MLLLTIVAVYINHTVHTTSCYVANDVVNRAVATCTQPKLLQHTSSVLQLPSKPLNLFISFSHDFAHVWGFVYFFNETHPKEGAAPTTFC